MAAQQWWMAVGGHQVGPVSEAEIVSNIRNGSVDAGTLVFTTGMSNWAPVREVPQLSAFLGHVVVATPGAPPPLRRQSHAIEFSIHGTEMQFVEVALEPGQSAVAEAGVMMYMTSGIEMEAVFGDGTPQEGGLMGALIGAGKRVLTGESLFMTVFTNNGGGTHRVAFAAPYAGKIIPMDLPSVGGELICQKDSFLCAARGVSISIAFQKKIGVGLFGGEGFIMQRLRGDGLCFVHAGGTIHTVDLGPSDTLRVDTGCLVALQPSVSYEIQFVGKVKTALFGGEGIFFAALRGPGKVWLQSLPFSRLADRIHRAAPRIGKGRKEEGSALDAFGLGDLIDGR